MNKTRSFGLGSAATLALLGALLLQGCASSICERKENWMRNNCVGGNVTWSPDATCEANLKNCNQGQLRQAEGYVACLESQNVCSLDTMAHCQEQFPGGVNLVCTGS
jgi:hypothetical protein